MRGGAAFSDREGCVGSFEVVGGGCSVVTQIDSRGGKNHVKVDCLETMILGREVLWVHEIKNSKGKG